METKLGFEGKVLAFATYKPKAGQEGTLLKLVEKHLPTLRELGLATDKTNCLAKSQDGTIIEIFEWTSADAVTAAHQHPAVSDIWEKMILVADFIPMSGLPESTRPFPSFEIIG